MHKVTQRLNKETENCKVYFLQIWADNFQAVKLAFLLIEAGLWYEFSWRFSQYFCKLLAVTNLLWVFIVFTGWDSRLPCKTASLSFCFPNSPFHLVPKGLVFPFASLFNPCLECQLEWKSWNWNAGAFIPVEWSLHCFLPHIVGSKGGWHIQWEFSCLSCLLPAELTSLCWQCIEVRPLKS